MVDVSVIVPVYNVEDYLGECLDSIVNQSLRNIEIICINDGSSDNSLDILNEYAKRDDRIKVIDQENAGLGASRNQGLINAKGKYVLFIDSDDYIDLTTLEKLYDNAISNDSDMVLYKFLKLNKNRISKRKVAFRIDEIFGQRDYSHFTFTYADVKPQVLNTAFSACLKLYKKEFLDSDDDFYFSTGTAFEDVLFHVKVMLNASRISFVPEYLYYYRFNQNSIVNTCENAFDILKVIDSVEEYLIKSDYYNEFIDEFNLFKVAQIYSYVKSSKSAEFFDLAKKEYESINLDGNEVISKYYLEAYELVMNSNDYNDYLKKQKDKNNLKSKNKPSSNNISFRNKLVRLFRKF